MIGYAHNRNLSVLAGLSGVALAFCLAPALNAQELSEEDKAIGNKVVLGGSAGAPAEWLGETPHFVLVGTYKDYEFAINLRDAAATEGVEFKAKREYRQGDGGLDYIDFEVALDLVTNGIERSIELEFENADFSDHPVPSTFALKGEEFPSGLFSNMEFQVEWEWVEKSVVVNEEELYVDGTLAVALEKAEPRADGTAPNGFIGGFATGIFDGKTIAVSFTAPVTEAEIDD